MNISTQRVMRSSGDVLPAVTFWRRIMMRACAAALGLAMSTVAQASLVIEGTRVVYKAGAPEVVVKMTNDGNTASLMQAWIDDGRAEATPDEMNVPFFLTPPWPVSSRAKARPCASFTPKAERRCPRTASHCSG